MLKCKFRQQRWSNMRMAAHFNLMGMTMTMQAKQTDVAAGRQAGRCSTLSNVMSTLPSRAYSACKAQLGPVPNALFLVSSCSTALQSVHPAQAHHPAQAQTWGPYPLHTTKHGYCRHQPRTDRREQAHTLQAGSLVYIVLHVSCVLFQRRMPCSRLAGAVC